MVSSAYWFALVVLVAVGVLVRVSWGALPVAGIAYRLRPGEAALLIGSLLALVFHCTAMFFSSETAAIPGLGSFVEPIMDLGVASQLAYAIPAVTLLVALRRTWWPALAALAAALAAVGITMFWSFTLNTHLAALAIAVALVMASTLGGLHPPRFRLHRA